MKRLGTRLLSALLLMLMVTGLLSPTVFAADGETAPTVESVTAQLEAIDTLQEMQKKRAEYKETSFCDFTTTDPAIIAAHEAARVGYESYIAQMFAARLAAQKAYDKLTDDQKKQIDATLVAKLSNKLDTVFNSDTIAVTPGNNAYSFEAVRGGPGYGYEVSNHRVCGEIPQIFVLVDTSDGKTSWTPNGLYGYGKSNYEVTYCCDYENGVTPYTDYKRINLEDSNYYGPTAAKHIRAILQNSYPFVSPEQMRAGLKAKGLNAEVADNLTRAEMISAVQMAVWTYANSKADKLINNYGYCSTIDVTSNQNNNWYTIMHDYTNEMWEWFSVGNRKHTYHPEVAYRVNSLAYFLCKLPGEEAEEVAISKVQVARADLIPDGSGQYRVGMYIYLNGGDANDDLKVYIESIDTDGNVIARSNQVVAGRTELEMSVKANIGNTIKVTVDGTQNLEKDVYFYEPEGGREASQCMVGVAEGNTRVHAEESFVFTENVDEMGLRIHKTAEGTGLPISDITFDVYKVEVAEGESLSEAPTTAEIEKYATEANKVASMTTDATGYTSAELKEGKYLVIEQNSDKVVEPVAPFYIQIPMTVTKGEGEGTTVETLKIVSLYPKNTPVTPPDNPPDLPTPPDNVTGQFIIEKYNELNRTQLLEGAVFEVYRAATAEDTDVKMITYDGIQYAVVPVFSNGEHLILTTDADGRATSPELPCNTYFLVETEAPDGFNLAAEAFTVTVISSVTGETVVAEIPNAPGNILPETGGIGTTIFYVLGGLLAVGAGVLLIAKKRMDDDK